MPGGEPKFENENPIDRESGISRVIGVSPEREKAVIEAYKNIEFRETEKTEQELQITDAVLQQMPDFIRKYGGVPVNVSTKKIHFINEGVDADSFRQVMGEDGEVEGSYSQRLQLVAVYKSKGDLYNAHKLAHELLHFNSFQSLEADTSDGLKHRRNGFSISDAEGNFLFDDIDEAVIERLAIKFDREYFPEIPCLKESVREREELKKHLVQKHPKSKKFIENAAFIAKNQDQFDVTTGRDEEIERLDEIIEKMYSENKEDFESEEDVLIFLQKQ